MSPRFDPVKGMTERSILRNTNSDVHIIHLYPRKEEGCTGFTNVRYTIETGIYLDPDMLVLGDIAELWEYRVNGKYACIEDGSTEVGVILNCHHKCTKKKEEGKLPKKAIIPKSWNVEDFYYFPDEPLPKDMNLFHFTALDQQPWFYDHPNSEAKALYEEYK